ncbi:leucine-rich repeat domain-containing protein [Maribacter polysiphoniae]|uniref:leucine-rich repeat domain-containing protein n=1 Tax=Maribacter polysiphoniae TaxID=429344 RepID=UPI0023520096|nr:DUF5018 domain-containing protein [Maribacter polysiphoniae]
MRNIYFTNYITPKHVFRLLCLIVVLFSFGCSKGDDPIPEKSSEKKITSFVFLLTNNPIDVNVVATIDEVSKTISATTPRGTNIKGLLPEIKISKQATIDFDTARDFTDPVDYTITAEDGSKAVYTVNISAPLSQKQVLQAILDANPGNTLGWDMDNAVDLGNLDGVSTDNGSVVELYIHSKNISVLPKEIGELVSLDLLVIKGNQLSTLPPEIGKLVNLSNLNLSSNQIASLPTEIGQLENLEYLNLFGNELTNLPTAIGRLKRLSQLDLRENELDTILPVLGQLNNLELLFADGNRLITLPPEIGQMSNMVSMSFDSNNIVSVPPEIGQLTNLESLSLEDNAILEIPKEMGLMTNLLYLNLWNNPLWNVPQSVCDLQSGNGGVLFLRTNIGVGCN